MKRTLVVIALAACAKPNDVPPLQEDARAVIKYYTPKIDLATRRLERVYEQSGKVPKDLPGADEALRALVDARDKIVELRKIEKDVEKALPTLGTEDKRADLERLVEDEEHKYEEGLMFVHENLSEVESFEANAIRAAGTQKAAAPPAAKDVPEGVIP
jgi:hypothetical protein